MSRPRFIPSFDNALNRGITCANDKNHRAYGLYILQLHPHIIQPSLLWSFPLRYSSVHIVPGNLSLICNQILIEKACGRGPTALKNMNVIEKLFSMACFCTHVLFLGGYFFFLMHKRTINTLSPGFWHVPIYVSII